MSDSDAALVTRIVRDDDRAAFELLVRRYQSPLRNFLRRLARENPDRADDLAQETFLKLYTSIESFRGTARFSTWLYRIAYNTFLNEQRSASSATSASEFDEALHSTSSSKRHCADLNRISPTTVSVNRCSAVCRNDAP